MEESDVSQDHVDDKSLEQSAEQSIEYFSPQKGEKFKVTDVLDWIKCRK